MICPGLVADDLSGFWKVCKPGDRDATRGTDGEEYRRAGALSTGAVERAIGTFAVEHFREVSLTAQRSGLVAQLNWKIEFDDCQSLRLSKSAPKSRV